MVREGLRSKSSINDYESFKNYLSTMHIKAIEVMNNLGDVDRGYIEKFFQDYYPTKKEHYWSLKKLFSLAMYIPMFLQIGLTAVEKKFFDAIIYVDTHAGPGLAKVGGDEKDIVLGSPMLAVEWPKVVGSKLKGFKKITKGFTQLYFIEKDPRTYNVLQRISHNMGNIGGTIKVYCGDSNYMLATIKREISREFNNPLILMFIDPYGEFSTQLRYGSLRSFVRDWAVDIVFNVMGPSLARGLMGKRANPWELRRCIEGLWGDLCNLSNVNLSLCLCYNNLTQCNIGVEDIVKAYQERLGLDGYKFVDYIPVEYEGRVLYYLLFASKGRRSQEWLGNYLNYLRTKAPNDYETLRRLWLQATGRLQSLSTWIKTTASKIRFKKVTQ